MIKIVTLNKLGTAILLNRSVLYYPRSFIKTRKQCGFYFPGRKEVVGETDKSAKERKSIVLTAVGKEFSS